MDKDHDTPVTGQVDKDGSCAGITAGPNQRCDEDSKEVSQGQWYHQNYWRPYRCDRVEKTVSRPPGENGPTTETVVEWENCRVDWTGTNLQRHGLQFFTDHPDPLPKSGERAYPSPSNQTAYWSLTDNTAKKDLEPQYWAYLERLGKDGPDFVGLDGQVAPDGGQANGYRSWCGAVPTRFQATKAGGADCQNQNHEGNNDHKWWTHGAVQGPPLTETVVTHTIYELHDHCDDANTVHRNEDGECPTTAPPVCETLPSAPVVSAGNPDNAHRVLVSWVVPTVGDTSPCVVDRYEVRERVGTGGWVDRGEQPAGPGNRLRVTVTQPNPGDGVLRVEVRARNNRAVDDDGDGEHDQWGPWGGVDVPERACAVPDRPVVTKHGYRNNQSEQLVKWTVTSPASPCEITGQEIKYGTEAARTLGEGDRESWELVPTDAASSVLVGVRAENKDGFGDWGYVTLHAPSEECDRPPSTPVLTRGADLPNGRTTVSWEVTDDGGDACTITGQQLRITISGQRPTTPPVNADDRDHDVPTPAEGFTPVTVEVRVQNNNVNTADRWSDWGALRLDWEAPTCSGPPGRPDPGYVNPNVTWGEPSAGGAGCTVLEYRIVRVPAGELGLPAVTQPADDTRLFEVPRPAAGQGDTVVRVAARNEHSWGRDGTVVVPEEEPSACATAPDTPVLSERGRSRGQVPVGWSVRSDGGPDCTLIAYEVDVEGEPVESFAGRGRTHRITEPAAGDSVRVGVRVLNEFDWSHWGWLTVGGACTVPGAPDVGVGDPYQLPNGRRSNFWYRDVDWSEPDDGGCSITRFQKSGWGGTVWIRNPEEDPWVARVQHPFSGTRTVQVRARNAIGWGPWGEVDIAACSGPPGAPRVTGRQVYGGGHQLAVSWSSGAEGGWCPNNQYEGLLVGGTSWRLYGGAFSYDLQWQPSVTETPVARVRARNEKGWGPWGEGTFTVCPAAPATPVVTVSDRAAHADEWGTPGAATKVSWTSSGTGGQHCSIGSYHYETTDTAEDRYDEPEQLLRTFDPDDGDVFWQDGYDWVSRAWDGMLEWLEPNVTTRNAPVAVRVRARNQFGWGEWGTNQLTLPEVPESCTGPPGAPVLTVGRPHHVPDPSMDWFSEVVRHGLHTRRWVTVSWDAVHDGGWTCEILSMDANSWEDLADDAPEWETGFRWRYTLAPTRRSVNVVYPEPGGVTTVWVWATNEFGRGATGSVRIIYAEQPACTMPPDAPRVTTHGFHADSSPNVRYYTIDDDHPGSGGEHCQIIRYEHEHQTATRSAVYADTNVHRLPGFGRIWETVSGLPPLGTATGDITVRVRAVNQHGPGPWREVPIEAVCPDDTPLAGERMEGLPATGCGTASSTVDPAACDNFYAFSEVYPWSYLWEVVDPWWDSLTAEQAVGWGLPYTEKGLSTAMAKCLIVAIG